MFFNLMKETRETDVMKLIYPTMIIGLGMLLSFSATVSALEPPVRIKAYGTHQGASIVYHYQVTNINGVGGLSSFYLGRNGTIDESVPHEDQPPDELSVMPIGWRHGREYSNGVEIVLAPESTTQPTGWIAEISGREATPGYWLVWSVPAGSNYPRILPSQTMKGFSVTLPQADKGFLSGHFNVGVTVDGIYTRYTGQIESLDATPPTLSVTLSPNNLWPPNEKLISITATLAVKDDYDPSPEIKLDSITANESLEEGDIKDAQIGADDRSFKLKAGRDGKNKAGRVYTVTYSTTDASGNKTTASATVMVPHDRAE